MLNKVSDQKLEGRISTLEEAQNLAGWHVNLIFPKQIQKDGNVRDIELQRTVLRAEPDRKYASQIRIVYYDPRIGEKSAYADKVRIIPIRDNSDYF